MVNALTIDVEDYFHVTAFESCISPTQWDSCQLRVTDNTLRILDLLDEFGVKATFFVLGWVAERQPGLVKEIVRHGHEVASHGYGHRRIYTLSRQEFRVDVHRSKDLLEQLAGEAVLGYRAPSYSISMDTLWAYDELLYAGYRYDSSVFPIRHDLYGIPDWPRFSFIVFKDREGRWRPLEPSASPLAGDGCFQSIQEIPITTLSIAGKSIPIAGGGYFRLFPYAFTKWALNRINSIEKRPFVFYFHPWEIDPEQPRMNGAGLKSRFRHYLNLHRTEERLRSLLTDFRFSKVQDISLIPAPDIFRMAN
jgi:polysaccharide deacetylase family protein (PEP-CTERM system associated)